jgi:hypothetical protein
VRPALWLANKYDDFVQRRTVVCQRIKLLDCFVFELNVYLVKYYNRFALILRINWHSLKLLYVLQISGARGGHIWLRHCATNRNVAGSISYGVIGIFHWHNPSGRTMALGFTQPLT